MVASATPSRVSPRVVELVGHDRMVAYSDSCLESLQRLCGTQQLMLQEEPPKEVSG